MITRMTRYREQKWTGQLDTRQRSEERRQVLGNLLKGTDNF